MKVEYDKFEGERSTWNSEKEKKHSIKRNLEGEIQQLNEEREALEAALKKDQEKKDVIK